MPDPFNVTSTEQNGRHVVVERKSDGGLFRRHSDDLKAFSGESGAETEPLVSKDITENECIQLWKNMFDLCNGGHEQELEEFESSNTLGGYEFINTHNANEAPVPAELRRGLRPRRPNPRYFNENLING